jgi:hypothetical protein
MRGMTYEGYYHDHEVNRPLIHLLSSYFVCVDSPLT